MGVRRGGLLIVAAAIATTAVLILSSAPSETSTEPANARKIGSYVQPAAGVQTTAGKTLKDKVSQSLQRSAPSGGLGSVPVTGVGAGGSSPAVLKAPPPSWYTPELHRQVLEAGPEGLEVDVPVLHDTIGFSCQGLVPNGISAGGCMVSPSGCTMNFIFADSSGSKYIGTAGHCVPETGVPVVVQVASRIADNSNISNGITLANIGTVVFTKNSGIGLDFGLVKITNTAHQVIPEVPLVGGPQGMVCGDNTGTPLKHYGHGYEVHVQQGYPRAGLVHNLFVDTLNLFRSPPSAYSWAGSALGGDSGSGTVHAQDLRAVGNLTHIGLLAGGPITVFGTRIESILFSTVFLGGAYKLVNANGTLATGCTGGPINQAPKASFTVNFPGKNGGNTGNFDASGSSDPDGNIVSYAWSFGDGSTGTGVQVSHAYAAEGTYTATLTVTDNGGASASASKTITCSKKGKNIRCSG